jgi:hypothetical protein
MSARILASEQAPGQPRAFPLARYLSNNLRSQRQPSPPSPREFAAAARRRSTHHRRVASHGAGGGAHRAPAPENALAASPLASLGSVPEEHAASPSSPSGAGAVGMAGSRAVLRTHTSALGSGRSRFLALSAILGLTPCQYLRRDWAHAAAARATTGRRCRSTGSVGVRARRVCGCMQVCVSVRACGRMQVCVCVRARVVCLWLCLCLCVCVRAGECKCACVCVRAGVCKCACACVRRRGVRVLRRAAGAFLRVLPEVRRARAAGGRPRAHERRQLRRRRRRRRRWCRRLQSGGTYRTPRLGGSAGCGLCCLSAWRVCV